MARRAAAGPPRRPGWRARCTRTTATTIAHLPARPRRRRACARSRSAADGRTDPRALRGGARRRHPLRRPRLPERLRRRRGPGRRWRRSRTAAGALAGQRHHASRSRSRCCARPGRAGADIAVAEGQSFGLPVSYGGPGRRALRHARAPRAQPCPAASSARRSTAQGRRGFVLTLATREQHIRRERATSNICTNQGLCALAVTVYLSLLGRHGLAPARARRTTAPRTRVAARLEAAGVARVASRRRSSTSSSCGRPDAAARWDALARARGWSPAIPLGRWYPELRDTLLLCVTESPSRGADRPPGRARSRPARRAARRAGG